MTRPMHQDAAAVLRMTMELLLLLLMFSLLSFPLITAECPDKCTCEENDVNCLNQKLDRIPDHLPTATGVLILSHNKIRDIEPKSLTHLTELTVLDLSYNKISDVKIGAFANLSNLRGLYLDLNKIENIETGVFNNLTLLENLYLAHNRIHKLDSEMFKGLTKLNKLFLYKNMIRKIPPGIFDSSTSLTILALDENPFTCDCDILWFVNLFKGSYSNHNVFGYEVPTCHFPVEMSGKLLIEVTENDVHCASPDVIEVPENKTVSVGEQLKLSCKAVGDPEPSITWAKDDIDLEPGQRVQVFQNNTLIISKVERTDGGQYKCVASNSLGRKSFEAMVNVNVYFLLQVFQDNTLIISKVEITDGGQYKCVASNSLGRKSFEAMVNVNGLAENGSNTMFGVIPYFSFIIIIILANCILHFDVL